MRETRRDSPIVSFILIFNLQFLRRCSSTFSKNLPSPTLRSCDHLGRAFGHDLAALVGRPGAEVDDVIGRLHHLQVVLDHDQRMADRQQGVETVQSCTVSEKCSPVVGSSRMNRQRPRLAADMYPASFSRWASPPESVLAGWPSRT